MEKKEFEFKIIKHIATLSTNKSWNMEANIVKFGDNEPKLDIRRWNEDHTKMSKGIQLTEEETMNLLRACQKSSKKKSDSKAKEKKVKKTK